MQDLWVRVGSTKNKGGETDPPCNGYKGPPENINPRDPVTTVFVPCDGPMKGGNVTVERVPLPPGWGGTLLVCLQFWAVLITGFYLRNPHLKAAWDEFKHTTSISEIAIFFGRWKPKGGLAPRWECFGTETSHLLL